MFIPIFSDIFFSANEEDSIAHDLFAVYGTTNVSDTLSLL
jgi:hypothetical protein